MVAICMYEAVKTEIGSISGSVVAFCLPVGNLRNGLLVIFISLD